jgi:hypothetical protein
VLRANVADRAERRACAAELLRWWLTGGHAADVARDMAQTVSPRLFRALRGAKRAVFGVSRPTRPGALPSVD